MIKGEDKDGNEVEGFTAEEVKPREDAIKAEYEGKLKDKDTHVNTKLDEFAKAKLIQDAKDAERDAKIGDAALKAEAAEKRAIEAEVRRQNSLKEVAMKQYVGDSPELKAKFEESWALINLEIKDDSDISKKAEMVANMVGLNNTSNMSGGMPMSGGYAPAPSAADKARKDADHSTFKDALGLGDFIPKQEENK